MRIAITGGSGFLGQEVVSLFERDGYIPVVVGRNLVTEKIKHEYRSTDYSKESLDIVLKDIDAVVHLAAARGGNGSISDFHQNEIITENIYNSCAELGVTNIVFASSISIYSDVVKIPWREEYIPSPKTSYGISKIACEYIGDIYHRKYGLNIKALRIAHILGAGERNGFMMNTFIDNAFQKKTLKVLGRSIARREFVYVKDVAKAILIAILNSKCNDVFNIGSGEAYTNFEIAKMVNKCFDNEENLVYKNWIEEGIESSLMDISKVRDKLGYSPEFSIEKALNDIKNIKLKGDYGV